MAHYVNVYVNARVFGMYLSSYLFPNEGVLSLTVTHQRFSHDHLNLLLGEHGELCEKALDDELPGLELGIDGDAGHGCSVKAALLPAEWNGQSRMASTRAAAAAAHWDRGWTQTQTDTEIKLRSDSNLMTHLHQHLTVLHFSQQKKT